MVANPKNIYFLQKNGAFSFLIAAFFACYLFFKPGSPHTIALVDHVVQIALAVISLLLALPVFLPGSGRTAPFSTLSKAPQRWVPRLLILSILGHALGQSILAYLEVHFIHIFPSWADVACLGALIPLMLAILFLPSQPLPAGKRVYIVLDGLMIMAGVITFSWYFLLGPTILHGATTLASRITSIAYPIATLLQISCLLLLIFRTKDQTIRPAAFVLSLAIAILTLTNTLFAYRQLYNLYTPGEPLDIGWAVSFLLLGLAARVLRLSQFSTPLPRRQEANIAFSSPLLWHSLLPYLLISSIILLLVFTYYIARDATLMPGIYTGAMVLVLLLALRQVFTVRMAVAQNKRLYCMQQDLHENYQALRHANEQLSHLNRLRNQFIANINHELRTPLTQIDGYLELLSEYQGRIDETTRATFIQRAKDGSQELLLLVNTVLDALRVESEVQPPHLEVVALWQVVHQVCKQFPLKEEQASRLCIDIPASLAVKADQHYLRQVICNLLSNALKYSPAEAVVTIRTQLIDQQEGSSVVCIRVQDAGPGIPPEEQVLLFQKFVRLKRDISGPVRGTGLGLYMCKQLVETMNGEIWVESSGKEGEGSCFCFTLSAAPSVPDESIFT